MAHIEPMGTLALDKMYDCLKTLTTDIDEIIQDCIDEAAPVMEKAYKGAMQGRVPVKVARSPSVTKAKMNMMGDFSVARTIGHSSRSGTRYGAIAAIYNYGAPERGIPATNFRDSAAKAAEGPATAIVNQKFTEIVNRLSK